ncbi:hypothetical protein BT96DRAFT_929707 [Gymnopus androsaceus JB14]|uniref:Alpha-type protein kinase domain-containing protein n=1 Tax=Gymnopus androsaceus JB14 TaxID=1447944 RepID=A0A6A4GDP5_9AGAR|nr:hypothetical protein BT96DRAFT_929707 [Gymnopus androsaceus JB14]
MPMDRLPILNQSAIPVRVFQAKTLHLDELVRLASCKANWEEYCEFPFSTTVYVDLDEKKALKGEFKMTSLGNSQPSIFQSSEVAVKQMFMTKSAIKTHAPAAGPSIAPLPASVVTRYYPLDPLDQLPRLLMELKLHQWGQALLNLVYSYIASLNKDEDVEKFIEIPKFRFVKAAIAIEELPMSSAKTRPRVFLVEEDLSVMKQGEFRKYMSNMPHVFVAFNNEEDAARAEFLRFTQHIMYWKTGKLAYVSDYQGNDSVLTDCQLMTHRQLGRVFADGNVPEGFEGLEDHHDCNNRFCDFFKPPPMSDIHQSKANLGNDSNAQ